MAEPTERDNMPHFKYSPVGYCYDADIYCLVCIPRVFGNGRQGIRPGGCNCAEHRLDRIAASKGLDRNDERSFDMSDFPKQIPYHNDIHSDCEPDSCYSRCASCGDVIDGVENTDGLDKCPVAVQATEGAWS